VLIKLNDKGVRVYEGGSRYRRYRTPLDWQNRTGTVATYSRDRSFAHVLWNGRSSYDRVLVDLIEPASSEETSYWRPFQRH